MAEMPMHVPPERSETPYAELTIAVPAQLAGVDADDAQHLDRAWELSRRYDNHPIYGMVYVAVAEAAGVEWISADQGLRSRLQHLKWVTAPDP